MGDITQDFFRAVKSGTNWKQAYDLCNGMDMTGMLRSFNALEPSYLTEFRARMSTYDVWGGPNMPRIGFALDVVQDKTLATPPVDLPGDQVAAAKAFLAHLKKGQPPGHEPTRVMEAWASRQKRGDGSTGNPYLYPAATSYLALSDKHMGPMTPLSDKCYGGVLNDVHGLAVHCTAGPVGPSAYVVANFRCVHTWNGNHASAHFAISGDGTVVQFVPTNYVANAQGKANGHWISVEIDNNGSAPMTLAQLTSTKDLFEWVCTTFFVPRRLATGHLCNESPWDGLTRNVCTAAGASVSDSQMETVASHGLSCHRWLSYDKQRKKVCPGAGILAQLPSIAKAGPVC